MIAFLPLLLTFCIRSVESRTARALLWNPQSLERLKTSICYGVRKPWLDYFQNLRTQGEDGVILVLQQSACPEICGEYTDVGSRGGTSILTYRMDGSDAVLSGERDMDDAQFNDLEVTAVVIDLDVDQSHLPGDQCIPTLTLHVYPSADLKESFRSNNPSIYAAVVVVIFLFKSLVFFLYDHFVNRRQSKIMERIAKQDTSRGGVTKQIETLAIVESHICDGGTVLEEFVPIIPLKRFEESEVRSRQSASSVDIGEEAKSQLRRFLNCIASMYQKNSFHNFEHAFHVTASVKKLLSRIVKVDNENGLGIATSHSDHLDLLDLAGHSCGITSFFP